MTGVIVIDEIFNNCARLPQGDAGVGVMDRWQAAIRVDGNVFGPLNICEWDGNNFMGNI